MSYDDLYFTMSKFYRKGYNISSALSYVEGQVMKSSSDIIKLLDLYESTMNASATTISRPWPIEQLD